MSKEKLDLLKRKYNIQLNKSMFSRLVHPKDLKSIVKYAEEQAELADYYRHQSKRKTQALEKIVDLLTEDYFENWEQALEIAHKYKRNSVRLDSLGSDLRIREMEEKNE